MTRQYLKYDKKDWWIGLLVIFLAFTYRLIIIVDRAETPSSISNFDPLPKGSDQATYYNAISEYRAGQFPPSTYFFQPGPSWLMVGVNWLIRTDNPGAMRVVVAWLAAVNCGLMIAVARLAFGRRWVSYLAGLLLALYPVSAFYDTDFVITSQATILVTVALFGVLWAWRQPPNWIAMILFGLSTGAIVLMRRELIIIAPVMGLWLLWKMRRLQTIFMLGLAALVAVGVTLPIIARNRAGGADYLITPVGMTELYRGHNRDNGGTYESRQASQTTTGDYLYFLWQDIRLSPKRFIELELHKIGLYLSSQEPGNNLHYVVSGKDISPVLAINPLNFSVLLVLFLLGMWQAIGRGEAVWSLFGIAFLACMASTLLVWIEARLRTPVVITMIPLAAYAVIVTMESIVEAIQKGRFSFNRRSAVAWAVPILLITVAIAFSEWATLKLPSKITAAQLPETAHATAIIYDRTLELAGWEIQENYSRAGLIQPFRPYVATFYWRLLKPTSVDYSFALGFFVDSQLVIGVDYPIGTVAYPDSSTSQWQANTIYVEHVGLSYKRFDGPMMRTGELLLNVYPERDAEALLPAVGLENEPLFIRLSQPAIIVGSGTLDSLTVSDTDEPFGDVLRLKGWQYPDTAPPGSLVPIQLAWETTAIPIQDSFSIGVYAFSADGSFVAQVDNPPRDGSLLTWSMPTEFLFEDSKSIQMPDLTGTYSLYVGIYDLATMERLVVPDTTDNLFKIGDIELK